MSSPWARRRTSSDRAAAVLSLVVVGATLLYVWLGRLIDGPSVFGDELIYVEAARSLAHGGSELVRGGSYGFGPLYPGLMAPLFRLAPDVPTAYGLVKAVNALLFALAAVPSYLLARRFVPTMWSALAAVLTVAVPSSMYSGLVLTESLGYLATCTTFLAIALVLEDPTIGRQVGLVVALTVAAGTRLQLAALVGVVAVAIAAWAVVARAGGLRSTNELRHLWPTAVALVVGVVVVVVIPVLRGSSPLRGYESLGSSYRPLGVARWTWYSLGDLVLYLGVVPFVVAPTVLVRRVSTFRNERIIEILGPLFLSANAVLLLVAAAFSSTSFGEGRLHDRYLFYVAPLWFVVFVVWLHAGAPTPRAPFVAGVALALALVATLPTSLLVRDRAHQLDGVATAVWAELRRLEPGRPSFLRAALVLIVAGIVAAVWLVASHGRVLLLAVAVAPVVLMLGGNAGIVWHDRVVDADRPVFSSSSVRDRSWVDRAVPSGRSVTTLYVGSPRCAASFVRDAFLWTEFFNDRIGGGAHLGGASSDSLPSDEVRVGANGSVFMTSGRPLDAGVVLAPPGVSLRGRLLARGTAVALGLWLVDGPVAIVGARSTAEVIAAACPSRGSA